MVDVVLPVLDEAAAIPLVLDRMPGGFRPIVVDNGSTDGSGDLARPLGALVVDEPRRGFGAACWAGLAAAEAQYSSCFATRRRRCGTTSKDSPDRGWKVSAAHRVPVDVRTPTEPATFIGSGGDGLAARLDLPDGEPRAFALFAHCFTCSKDLAAATRISRGLVERGFGVLRFDFTGLGSSEGEFANTDFSSNVEDLVLAAGWLRDNHEAPAVLVGHSLGGAAVLGAASRVPEVVAVATIGAPFDPAHVTELFPATVLNRLERDGEAEVKLAGRTFRVRRQLLEDLTAQNLTAAIGSLRRALLVFHSPVDEIVDVDNARRIFEAARHPRSFVSLDGADHLLTRRSEAAYVADVLSAWAGRYLPERAEAPAPSRPGSEPGTVVVAETGTGGFQQLVTAGRHRFLADEPVGIGDDSGATPYDLLLASLGTCTSMTLRMYAERKGWPLGRVEISLSHGRIHAQDCADCEASSGLIETIDRTIELDGPLTEEQRRSLLAIADRCPVHRTLTGDVHIRTNVVHLPGPDDAESIHRPARRRSAGPHPDDSR